jgi:hypothetical protein
LRRSARGRKELREFFLRREFSSAEEREEGRMRLLVREPREEMEELEEEVDLGAGWTDGEG